MRNYTLKKISGAPDWSKIPEMPIDHLLWTDSIDVSAKAQICWDEEALHLRMEAVEPHIRMEETGLLAACCEDSCLEFFFSPVDKLDYCNVEMNPNRAVWLGVGRPGEPLIRLLVSEPEVYFDSRVDFTDCGWVLTYQIPFAFIRRFFPEFAPAEGYQMRANAYKCGDKTKKEHYLAWNAIPLPSPQFHCPEYFGCLTFGGEE